MSIILVIMTVKFGGQKICSQINGFLLLLYRFRSHLVEFFFTLMQIFRTVLKKKFEFSVNILGVNQRPWKSSLVKITNRYAGICLSAYFQKVTYMLTATVFH